MKGARARLALLGALVLWPAAAQAQPSPALASYVQGLDAFRPGRHDEATAALGRAVQAAPDPSFILARGVAQCLEAASPREALRIHQSHPGLIDLLLTDVVRAVHVEVYRSGPRRGRRADGVHRTAPAEALHARRADRPRPRSPGRPIRASA